MFDSNALHKCRRRYSVSFESNHSLRNLEEIRITHPFLMVVTILHGGHIGWHDGNCFSSQCNWVKRVVHEFFEALLDES